MTTETKETTASAEVREKAQTIARSEKNIATRAAALVTQNTSWGKACTPEQRAAIEEIAREMGLSVAAGHIIVLGGNPYITVAGHMTHMHNQGGPDAFDEDALPKSDWEKWGVPADSWCAWRVTITRNKIPYTEVGWSGPARDRTEVYKSGEDPIPVKFKGEMARKRGRVRALQLAFPNGLPSVEEIQRGEEMPDEIFEKAKAAAADPIINAKIVEHEAKSRGFDLASIGDVAQLQFQKDWRVLKQSEMEQVYQILKDERDAKDEQSIAERENHAVDIFDAK